MSPLTERFELRLDTDTLESIDSWRSKQSDLPSRGEAIRQMVQIGLANSSATPLRFSGGETLILHMLCQLFKSQKVKSEIDPSFVEAALHGGHLWGLEWEYSGIFHRHVDPPAVVSDVVNILDMWEAIEEGFEELAKEEKSRVEKEVEPFGKDPRFSGFDGNNETTHMGVARFFIDDLKRFSRFKGRALNSHMPSLEMYRRMFAVYAPMRKTLMGGHLTSSQIIALLTARRCTKN